MFEAWILKQVTVDDDEEILRSDVRKLSDTEREDYFRKCNRLLKDPDTYAILNWFFLTGLHHYYLGKYIRGSINLFGMALGIILLLNALPVGAVIIAVIFLIEIPCLFRSQIIVANHNTEIGRQILESKNRQ